MAKPELIVALIAGAVALSSAIIAIWGQVKSARVTAGLQDLRLAEDRRQEREKVVSRYREPLARSAYDLQSRLYNILKQNLIKVYYTKGNERERSYVVNNTVFVVAQYFAWTEIIRREIQFIDLGEDAQTRQLTRLQDEIYSLWQTDSFGPLFRVFAGEQRAIGERMTRDSSRGSECIGYASFLDEIDKNPSSLINTLCEDVRVFSSRLDEARPRLAAVQNAMIDLLAFLDPEYVRFPKERRTKLEQPACPIPGGENGTKSKPERQAPPRA
jgi:hypothetical protein